MIGIIIGAQGSGKTTLLSYILYKAYEKNFTIYSNFDFALPHETVTMKEITSLVSENIQNACIGIDEAEAVIDSRTSQSRFNRIMSYWVYQSRKRNNALYLCSHILGAIDMRVRREATHLFRCHGYDATTDTLRYLAMDLQNGKNSLHVLSHTSFLFQLFDTRQKIENMREPGDGDKKNK